LKEFNIIAICNAGNDIGLGHVKRLESAVKTLKANFNINCAKLLILTDKKIPVRIDIEYEYKSYNYNLSLIDTPQTAYNLIIFDLSEKCLPNTIQDSLKIYKNKNKIIVAIECLSSYIKYIDLFYVPSFIYNNLENTELCRKLIYGWDCYLLNNSIKNKKWKPGNNVIVLTGGADVTKLGNRWPKLLDENLGGNTELKWVTGPYSENPDIPINNKINFREIRSPQNIHKIISWANYALCLFGVSFFEVIKQGIPTVVISAKNENKNELNEIRNKKVAIVGKSELDAVIKLKNLMSDKGLASLLSNNSTKITSNCDGSRLVNELSKIIKC
jgi:spore coat polysaccharide biosynthesis predicted glycosyltransferase SpsG